MRACALRTARMDSHKLRAFSRLEVVETGRRRRFSEDEKLKIVMESLAVPRLVSATARRHGISRSLLLTWRRAFQAVTLRRGPRVRLAWSCVAGRTVVQR